MAATFVKFLEQENGRRVRVVRCPCGCELELWSNWSNGCDVCDREYNGAGQTLAPRAQWGEETGELGDWG